MKNPFAVRTPESLSPKEVADLFIDVFSDFPKIKDVGHTFIHGPRGSGKSMMLKYLEPSVQLHAGKVSRIEDLDFLAVHIPFKVAGLDITDIQRLEGDSYLYLSEHLMLMHITSLLLNLLSELYEKDTLRQDEINDFFQNTFLKLITVAGSDVAKEECPTFQRMAKICDEERQKSILYIKKLSFSKDYMPYTGALCGYTDFFQPLSQAIKSLPFTPNGPIYLMLDDADNLSERMQNILNTWVSCRTTQYLCLKISTQQRYKTYRTLNGQLIDSTHDYTEVDISTLYTSQKDHYLRRINDIVSKRLTLAGVDKPPQEYFPSDKKQDERISVFKSELKAKWEKGEGKGHRASDDVTRYAIPDYMKSLAQKKASATYSYAGFKNIVDISSGIIRFFLEPAAQMYSEAKAQQAQNELLCSIPPAIQDGVLKSWSEEFILSEFEKLKRDAENNDEPSIVSKLYCLINSLGELFRQMLLSEGSQRRIFSIMVTGKMDETLEHVFELGVEWGYFQRSTAPSKEGYGRQYRFVLSRRLAPYFKLDASSYAGQLSVTVEDLNLACIDSDTFVKRRMSKIQKDQKLNQIDLFKDQSL
ncbi:ORC-CDC6 family AAA ATPase [Methylobacter sp. sgz302048]|uniref:ORC-CDC6 family AAA ATPase n=1 Tax=Methylobacter sp. sgz302048 TaxID=3455945 RepID=UPI003FA18BD7